MLLSEFLREHRKNKKQKARINLQPAISAYIRLEDAVTRVYRTCLLLIFCQSHILSRPACGVGVCLARYYIQLYLRRFGIASIWIHPHNDGVLTCRQVAAVISALGKASYVLTID
jgi:hypothetical protein